MEEIEFYLEEAKEGMEKAVAAVSHEMMRIRAGKASASMLDGITVEYYGAVTPLSQVSSVTTPDARTISIKPFEKSLINEIERSIINSDLGLAPMNNGEMIILTIPPVTEERRKELVKQAKSEAENGKIRVRRVRQETNDALKKLKGDGASEDMIKDAEDSVQKLTNTYYGKIEEVFAKKENDIMTV
ncbi:MULTISPECIES: ribosome recycling factor [Persicobacter]|uniref:Ribosome-recycling factor n=1 Tax=Persicobacter diffluens TaxID=981 RepID=A0AAN5AMQ1_9BACT|nr:ribosome recycling factor [Persicobacter sp. CCB-QB2]GJM62083.1 ribosome-recycling factor [Persicobacter diffluens]